MVKGDVLYDWEDPGLHHLCDKKKEKGRGGEEKVAYEWDYEAPPPPPDMH